MNSHISHTALIYQFHFLFTLFSKRLNIAMGVFQKEMWLYYYVDVTNMKDDI